mmetsp:Transcript_44742/g.107420  ORF Transcript_44742/g.107420 Transcript_44742/m.107420 type:complete len:240 (+) Transcript_44742:222-941(+)
MAVVPRRSSSARPSSAASRSCCGDPGVSSAMPLADSSDSSSRRARADNGSPVAEEIRGLKEIGPPRLARSGPVREPEWLCEEAEVGQRSEWLCEEVQVGRPRGGGEGCEGGSGDRRSSTECISSSNSSTESTTVSSPRGWSARRRWRARAAAPPADELVAELGRTRSSRRPPGEEVADDGLFDLAAASAPPAAGPPKTPIGVTTIWLGSAHAWSLMRSRISLACSPVLLMSSRWASAAM